MSADTLPGGEHILRYGGDRTGGVVHVVDVGDVVLIDISDIGVVHDRRVGHVDVAHVGGAHVIARHVDLARRQREPADVGADTYGNTPGGSTHPGHQRGCIHRTQAPRARHPAPGAVPLHPAAVVKRCVAPGRIIDPRPTPGRDPHPVTEAVGRPAGHDHGRRPDVTVVRRLLPAPVGVQILRAGDVVRDVLARGRVLQLTLTPRGPAVQIIRSPQGGALISDRVRAGEGDPLLSADGDRLPAARGLRLPLAHLDDGGVACVVDLHAILARLLQREGDVRSIDLVGLISLQVPHAHDEGARRDLHLRGVVIEIEE